LRLRQLFHRHFNFGERAYFLKLYSNSYVAQLRSFIHRAARALRALDRRLVVKPARPHRFETLQSLQL
jgi:uncharacterized membrane protein